MKTVNPLMPRTEVSVTVAPAIRPMPRMIEIARTLGTARKNVFCLGGFLVGGLWLPLCLHAAPLEGETLSVGAQGLSPAVRTGLQVEPNGTVWAGSGAGYDSSSATPVGAGTRLMWLSEKSAFRAGSLFEPWHNLWEYANIGPYSFAWGINNEASGYAATAWGELNYAGDAHATAWGGGNVAQGYAATAWGRENLARSDQATAFGYYTEASGHSATSWGRDTRATGDYATAFGERSHAAAYLSTVFGRDNIGGFTEATGGATGDTQWVARDPLFEVGVGDGLDGSANAFSLMKDGRAAVGIHTAHPDGDETLVVYGALQLSDYAEPASASPAPGALRYRAGDFEGYDGSQWRSLSHGGSGSRASSLIDPADGQSVIVATLPGSVTIQGGRYQQGSSGTVVPPTAGNLLRMGGLSTGGASGDYGANHFQWFGELEFPSGGAAVAYLYLGEAPMELWGYFDLTVTADYWQPEFGRGALSKRFPMAFTEWGNPDNPALIGLDEEPSQVTAATGGIADFVSIGEVEVVGDQVRVPIYFRAGAHTVSGLHLSGMFLRAYNTPGYPYAEIEPYAGSIELDNAIEMTDLELSGTLRLADGTELNGAVDLGAGAGTGSTLVDPSASERTVVEVAAGGATVTIVANLEVTGSLTLSAPSGDMSMGAFTAH